MMHKSFFQKGDHVYQNKIFSFKTTAIKKPASAWPQLSTFVCLVTEILLCSAGNFRLWGTRDVSGVAFACRSRVTSRDYPKWEIVSGLICLLFIDFYNLFRMFPDFSLLLQNIPRITDLHVTCSCRSSPLSQSLVLSGKWIFSILNNETLPIFLHGVKSPANSPQ